MDDPALYSIHIGQVAIRWLLRDKGPVLRIGDSTREELSPCWVRSPIRPWHYEVARRPIPREMLGDPVMWADHALSLADEDPAG